jgi:pyruvate/2-oxoglutarate/acetoin dehydrogenase E1 component
MVNFGVGAEVAATIQDAAFLHLKAPVKRIGGWTTHTGLAFEKLILPDVARKTLFFAALNIKNLIQVIGVYDAIEKVLNYLSTRTGE